MKMKNSIAESRGDKLFGVINGAVLLILTLMIAYPIYFILIASISDPTYVNLGETLLLPKGLNFDGYRKIIEFPEISRGYINSIKYTIIGTSINLAVCVPAAFALSRKELSGRKIINVFFVVTMYFNGGLVPTYMVIKNLNLMNTMWALMLPGALNVYNLIVCRSFFMSNISEELFEATKIDGGGYFTFFFKVVFPLSKAIVAVMVLYHALVHWNQYLSALYYIKDTDKFPLQLVLRNLTATLNVDSMQDALDASAVSAQIKAKQSVRYSVIIAASVPVFLMYPFIQKYFVKGVMVGSVKG